MTDLMAESFKAFFVFATGFTETSRNCCYGQYALGKHNLDGLTDRSFPLHALSGHPEETWSSTVLAGRLQYRRKHRLHSCTSYRGSPPSPLLIYSTEISKMNAI